MSRMTLNDAVGLLISTADARMQMWRGVAEGKSPDDLVDDLWDSCSTGPYDEARAMSYWDNDPDYPVEDWRAEVAADDTRQSYTEWIARKREEARDDADQ